MAAIKSKNTKPELEVRKYLFSLGFRYRLHNKSLPGKPDISNMKKKIAIFVNGCFWHSHKGCKYAFKPKTRADWWKKKLDSKEVSSEVTSEVRVTLVAKAEKMLP